jgi:hypothetical protein
MIDTTPITNTVAKLITESKLVASVVRQFPQLTSADTKPSTPILSPEAHNDRP